MACVIDNASDLIDINRCKETCVEFECMWEYDKVRCMRKYVCRAEKNFPLAKIIYLPLRLRILGLNFVR